jgi:hypothetical protein
MRIYLWSAPTVDVFEVTVFGMRIKQLSIAGSATLTADKCRLSPEARRKASGQALPPNKCPNGDKNDYI